LDFQTSNPRRCRAALATALDILRGLQNAPALLLTHLLD
jgi:hypothetical protein